MSNVTHMNSTGVNTLSTKEGDSTSPHYTRKFFSTRQTQTWKAASRVVPRVLEVVQPRSVIDVGCGTGEFLAMFRECGVDDILGIDGAYVQRELLAIPQDAFIPYDLNQPITVERTFELVVCLEVAEHLLPRSAATFVASLTRMGSIILFSAAIPHQGGNAHINEQWPDYWAALFREYGYVPVDALRRGIWQDAEIPYWYRQNMLFFCTEEALATSDKLTQAYKTTTPDALSVVHPEMFLECNTKYLRMLRHWLTYTTPLWRMKENIRRRF